MLKNITKCHKVKIQQFIAKHFKFIVYHTEKYPITRVISSRHFRFDVASKKVEVLVVKVGVFLVLTLS